MLDEKFICATGYIYFLLSTFIFSGIFSIQIITAEVCLDLHFHKIIFRNMSIRSKQYKCEIVNYTNIK